MKKQLVSLYLFSVCAVFIYYIKKTAESQFAVSLFCKGVTQSHEKGRVTSSSRVPTIYLITPTYKRNTQKAELTRFHQTLLHVHKIHWIIIEDSINKTALITDFIARMTFPVTHLNARTEGNNGLKGLLQRNAGLKWIRTHVNPSINPGVVYFADDDNTYDLRIFEEMRYTKKVSVWPVAFVGSALYEQPIVENGKVVRWRAYFDPRREFAVDMAGFALNIDVLFKKRDPYFDSDVAQYYQEPRFLRKFVKKEDLEPKAENCTRIWVWHTKTINPVIHGELQIRSDNQKRNVTEPYLEV